MRRSPRGVFSCSAMITRKAAPAPAAGCTIVSSRPSRRPAGAGPWLDPGLSVPACRRAVQRGHAGQSQGAIGGVMTAT